MSPRRSVILLLLFVVLVVGLVSWRGLARLSLSALNEPGPAEVRIATSLKRWLVRRSARGPLPASPPNGAVSVASGRMQFGARCAACHGTDGRTPTDIGRWMYPRATDLGSPGVQRWTDAELFWIIKNGIRPTGMPGFARIHSDEEIWNLVHFVRSLGTVPR
ncbi:MAG: cytochrome c [Acidobacteria bacterium]|nr:cytochrome c [Acidobacteriota bacterium]